MENFFNKFGSKLKTAALIFMLAIPFLLYAAAVYGSIFQVNIVLALMTGNMLFVMLKG